MFDKITLKSTYQAPLNLGRLCETLLFYQHVHLLIGEDALKSILTRVDVMRHLLEYKKRGLITVHMMSTIVTVRGMSSHYQPKWEKKILRIC
jgi:hypothetical protein